MKRPKDNTAPAALGTDSQHGSKGQRSQVKAAQDRSLLPQIVRSFPREQHEALPGFSCCCKRALGVRVQMGDINPLKSQTVAQSGHVRKFPLCAQVCRRREQIIKKSACWLDFTGPCETINHSVCHSFTLFLQKFFCFGVFLLLFYLYFTSVRLVLLLLWPLTFCNWQFAVSLCMSRKAGGAITSGDTVTVLQKTLKWAHYFFFCSIFCMLT